jgi:hypothetical protein
MFRISSVAKPMLGLALCAGVHSPSALADQRKAPAPRAAPAPRVTPAPVAQRVAPRAVPTPQAPPVTQKLISPPATIKPAAPPAGRNARLVPAGNPVVGVRPPAKAIVGLPPVRTDGAKTPAAVPFPKTLPVAGGPIKSTDLARLPARDPKSGATLPSTLSGDPRRTGIKLSNPNTGTAGGGTPVRTNCPTVPADTTPTGTGTETTPPTGGGNCPPPCQQNPCGQGQTPPQGGNCPNGSGGTCPNTDGGGASGGGGTTGRGGGGGGGSGGGGGTTSGGGGGGTGAGGGGTGGGQQQPVDQRGQYGPYVRADRAIEVVNHFKSLGYNAYYRNIYTSESPEYVVYVE